MNGCFINEYILALKISFVQYLQLQYNLTPQTLKTKLENISLLSLLMSISQLMKLCKGPATAEKIKLSNSRCLMSNV